MANVINIQTLDELRRFLNDKGIMEIALRGKNKKFKTFQKIAQDQLQQNEVSEKDQQAINILNRNNNLSEKSLKMLNGVSKLNKLNLVLSGLNLCATCVGFAIMYKVRSWKDRCFSLPDRFAAGMAPSFSSHSVPHTSSSRTDHFV